MGPTDPDSVMTGDPLYENVVRMELDDDHYNSDRAMAMAAGQFMSTFPQVEWTEVRSNAPAKAGEVIPLRYRNGDRVPI